LDAQLKAETAAKDTTEEKVHELNSKIADINGKLSPCKEKLAEMKQKGDQDVDAHNKDLKQKQDKISSINTAIEKIKEESTKLEEELTTMKGGIDIQTKKHEANQDKINDLQKKLEDCQDSAKQGDDTTTCTKLLFDQIIQRRSFKFMGCNNTMTEENEKLAKETIKEVIAVFKPLRHIDTNLKLFTHGWRGGNGCKDELKIPCQVAFKKKHGHNLSQGRANKIQRLLNEEAQGEHL